MTETMKSEKRKAKNEIFKAYAWAKNIPWLCPKLAPRNEAIHLVVTWTGEVVPATWGGDGGTWRRLYGISSHALAVVGWVPFPRSDKSDLKRLTPKIKKEAAK